MSLRAKRPFALCWLLAAIAASPVSPARAADPGAGANALAALDCRGAAELAEREAGLPSGLLLAIGKIESGRFDPRTGQTSPWPWSTDLDGEDHVFASQAEALSWTGERLAEGRRSIDVGCFQINLFYHPNAFSSLEEAFDPTANARYAARFLIDLFQRVGSWPLAVAQYHSADPSLGLPYGHKVYAVWGATDTAFGPSLGMLPGPFTGASRPSRSAIDPVVIRISARALTIRVIGPTLAIPVMPAAGSTTVAAGTLALAPRRNRGLPRIITPG